MEAVLSDEIDVEQYAVRAPAIKRCEGLVAARGDVEQVETPNREECLSRPQKAGIVIDDEDACSHS